MGDSHWRSVVSEGCLTLNSSTTPLKSVDPYGATLKIQWFLLLLAFFLFFLDVHMLLSCCSPCYCRSHTLGQGKEMSYFTNIVVHNI